MPAKDIKRLVIKQLKANFPNWFPSGNWLFYGYGFSVGRPFWADAGLIRAYESKVGGKLIIFAEFIPFPGEPLPWSGRPG